MRCLVGPDTADMERADPPVPGVLRVPGQGGPGCLGWKDRMRIISRRTPEILRSVKQLFTYR